MERITVNPNIFGGKPIIRGRYLAVEYILGMSAAGDSSETLLEGYPWYRIGGYTSLFDLRTKNGGHERIETFPL